MQIGSTSGAVDAIVLPQSAPANPTEQANLQAQQQEQVVLQDTSQQTQLNTADGNPGQNINTLV